MTPASDPSLARDVILVRRRASAKLPAESECVRGCPPVRRLEFIDRDRAVDAESPGFRPPQILQMRTATERLADIVRVGANIKAFAADHAEIDFRRSDPIDRVAIDVHQARFALDHFSLARQFVERHAALFDRRNHRRHLVKIAANISQTRRERGLGQLRHGPLFDHLARAVLRVGRYAQRSSCRRIPCPRS